MSHGLPYNAAWRLRLNAGTRAFLRRHPLIVADVGCRNGSAPELATLAPFVRYFAFDADAEECARLDSAPHPYAEFRALPYFVGDRDGETGFHLYRELAESSVYPPAERYARLVGGPAFAISRTITVPSRTLASISRAEDLPPFDFLKLDVQGAELAILEGSRELLPRIPLIEAETAFTPLYAGQPLFHDVAALLYAEGYELLYLNRVFGHLSQVYEGPARGPLLFGDALFGRREDRLEGIDDPRRAHYALLLLNAGLADLALAVIHAHPETTALLPELGDYFERQSLAGKVRRRLRRRLLPWLDAPLRTLLRLRRYNGWTHDSDRSWPVR